MATLIYRELAGKTITIRVDERDGEFSYESKNGEIHLSGPSLPALVERIKKALTEKRVQAKVAVGIVRGGEPHNVYLTQFSKHDYGKVLTKDMDGTASDWSVRRSEEVYQPWSVETADEFRRLRDAARVADKALADFVATRRAGPERKSDAEDILAPVLQQKERERDARQASEEARADAAKDEDARRDERPEGVQP